MSSDYKYTYISFDPQYIAQPDPLSTIVDPATALTVLGVVVAARAAQAVVEEGRRLDREEAVLVAGLNDAKCSSRTELESVTALFAASRENLLAADAMSLNSRLTALQTSLATARTHGDLTNVSAQISSAVRAIHVASERKARFDAEQPGAAAGPRRAVFEALRARGFGAGSPDDDPGNGPLDPEGARAVRVAVAEAYAALQGRDEAKMDRKIGVLREAVEKREEKISAEMAIKACQKRAAMQLNALVQGLQGDDVAMRWQAGEIEELGARPVKAASDAEADAFEASAREEAARIVLVANTAQVKADQRDYIARGIRDVFEQMGYIVDGPTAEYPEHPATASLLRAVGPSGRVVAGSVPFEGEVWYNVDGFVKTIQGAVGGGAATVCDEAEAVIDDMREALAQQYHVQLDELLWEGKDPNRVLREAKQLPKASGSDRML